ncbi:hypothetical protein PUN28_004009 [Cardiocondyla obscurior]|uniref:Uncharacterized protein n=1 Tax=Cardiocondyla obscurior TaxID=286306 RepID=A0AAW2GPD4_9HYME
MSKRFSPRTCLLFRSDLTQGSLDCRIRRANRVTFLAQCWTDLLDEMSHELRCRPRLRRFCLNDSPKSDGDAAGWRSPLARSDGPRIPGLMELFYRRLDFAGRSILYIRADDSARGGERHAKAC